MWCAPVHVLGRRCAVPLAREDTVPVASSSCLIRNESSGNGVILELLSLCFSSCHLRIWMKELCCGSQVCLLKTGPQSSPSKKTGGKLNQMFNKQDAGQAA